MNKYILWLVFILWNILHISFLKLNEILKIADSFAYLQMAHYLKNFSIDWFWNWWFWFLYSLPIAITDFFIKNDMLSSFIVNILFFNLLALICFILGRNYLTFKYNILFIILVFLSPILLNYNIHILSENIYIPLFLIFFVWILRYKDIPNFSGSVFLWLMLALLYYTRSEAFIYIWSIWLLMLFLLFSKYITFSKAILNFLTIIISFWVFISPYIYYMHSFTWEWGLTNKWSSNLRQAELRGVSKMDDDWFEQAVWELTLDNHHLIAWFAWGLKYDKPMEWESFKNYILKNPFKVLERVKQNQIKLYTNNLPNLILWNAKSLYEIEWSKIFYKNILFLMILLVPIIFLFYGIIIFIKNWGWYFIFSFASFFFTASIFFTLFFVLDRYFVIFVPILIFFIVYWLQSVWTKMKPKFEITKYIIFSLLFIWIYSLWILSYYNTFVYEDDKYEVKKIAWEWLSKNDFRKNLKIMERFPIVTYYSGSFERWLTPYTSSLESLVEYAKYNDINYLVVDSIDFYKYRPWLAFLFDEPNKNYKWLLKLKEFEKNSQKVILYRIK